MRLGRAKRCLPNRHRCRLRWNSGKSPARINSPFGQFSFVGCHIAGISLTELIRPMLPLLAIMFGVLLFVTYVTERFMWHRKSWPDFVFAFRDDEELGLRMLARNAQHTGLRPEDL